MSQAELARRMGRPLKTINEIVNGKASITADTALQLELALGVSAGVWTGLERLYRDHLARQRAAVAFSNEVEWASSFPVSAMRKQGLISARTGAALVQDLLAFFGVSSRAAWEQQWARTSVSLRRPAGSAPDTAALTVWLRWGEVLASDVATKPFDEGALRRVAADSRGLTRRQPPSVAVDEFRSRLAACGVALVMVPEMPGMTASGAARWLTPRRAVVQLSLRYKQDDQLWFSLYHELGHLDQDRGTDFVDPEVDVYASDPAEARANGFARDLLVEDRWIALLRSAGPTESAVREVAREADVAPGILVGRLQHDGVLDRHQLNSLKKSIRWG